MTNKNTDIIQKTEQQYMEELSILKDSNVGSERKTKARRNIKNYEKYLKDNSDKEINGKKYPNPLFHSGPEPMNKTELTKLIDSVYIEDEWRGRTITMTDVDFEPVDLSGVSVGKNRFIFTE